MLTHKTMSLSNVFFKSQSTLIKKNTSHRKTKMYYKRTRSLIKMHDDFTAQCSFVVFILFPTAMNCDYLHGRTGQYRGPRRPWFCICFVVHKRFFYAQDLFYTPFLWSSFRVLEYGDQLALFQFWF